MEYGLIGSKLGHSYSKIIHEMLCGYRYDLCPLPTEEEARAFLTRRAFKAINVTIPYKRLVMESCSYIDPRAKAIGAVNTVVNRNGLLYGYNTDYLGFAYLADAHGVEFAGRTVLILGTGGTHNTTSAVAKDKGAARVLTVSRHPDPEKGELSYAEAVHSGADIVINTTPAGMYPNVGICHLDVAAMPGLEAVLDVVYNPDKTELILRAEEAGVPVAVGGLEMLVAQAVYAAEYFLDRKFDDAPAEIRAITAQLRKEQLNVALIGMPSCGKTTIGKLIAGLYRPSGGRIMLFGKPQNPKQLQKQVLFILQEAEFQFFTGSVLHELQYGHAVTPEFEAKTEALLKSMDMWDCRDRHPFSLSGGQMQRLTLMMAYLSDKPIVILDEPTAGQDAGSLERCAALIREMRKEKTVLIITHDLELIADACDYCIGLSDGHAEAEFPVHSERNLQAVRQYMERFHPSDAPAKKQHKERFHPATKLLYWLALLVVISTSNNHLVYAVYTALILLTAADGWFGTALAGGMSFGLLWAANALLPGTVFSFMLVLFPRIIAVGISMRTLIGRNEASRTLAALRNLHLPERLIMIVAVIFRFFPVLSGDMKLLRQSIRTRGAFATPLQKLRALPSYIEILTVPMALRVIRIAETLSASAETRGIDLKRRKSNYLSLRFSAWDVVFCALLAASIAAGLIL